VNYRFILDILTIVTIDLVLSGDNGVVIAMAVRNLPPRLRRRAIAAGGGCAALFQITLSIVAMQLLRAPFLKLAGGLMILWISLQLFRETASAKETRSRQSGMWKAIGFIVIANLTMSTDNVLAVAAAAHGNPALLIFGLCISVPLVIFGSAFLAGLMDKHPIIVYIGAAILGKVAGEMIIDDGAVTDFFHPNMWVRYGVQAAGALLVLVAGCLLMRGGRHPGDGGNDTGKSDPNDDLVEPVERASR